MFLNIEKRELGQWKETLLSFLVAVLCFSLVYFFPVNGFLQNLTKNVFFLLVIPFLYIKLILQKDLFDFGINLDRKKIGIIWGGSMLLFLLVLFFFIIRYTKFEEIYPIPTLIKINFGYFLFYELILVNLLFLLQEIFFKGFLLSALRKKLGGWSILIQSAIFLFPLLIDSSYLVAYLPTIAISLFGGLLAYKTRTFAFSYLFSVIFLIILDAYIISINK